MGKRLNIISWSSLVAIAISAPAGAQTIEGPPSKNDLVAAVAPDTSSALVSLNAIIVSGQQPAGPPQTPRHTGIKTMAKHLVTNFKYLPSKENLLWASTGGGLALAAHPF